MIVKKVPTSTVAPPKSKARNIQALCDYIAGPDAGREAERLEHRGALNLLNIDHDGQVQEIMDLAAVDQRQLFFPVWRQLFLPIGRRGVVVVRQ